MKQRSVVVKAAFGRVPFSEEFATNSLHIKSSISLRLFVFNYFVEWKECFDLLLAIGTVSKGSTSKFNDFCHFGSIEKFTIFSFILQN